MKIRTFVVLIAAIGVGAWLLSSAEGGYSTKLNSTDNMAENISYATFADDAAFTPAGSGVLMFGAEADDTSPDSVTEGDAGAVRMSLRRELYVQLRDAAGNERGLNVDASGRINVVEASAATIAGAVKAEDAAHTTGDAGIPALAVQRDTLAALAGTAGDYVPLQTNASGALFVDTSGGGFAEDAAHTSGDRGLELLAVMDNAPKTAKAADGDYAPLMLDDDGDLYVVDGAAIALLTTIDADTSKIPSQGTAAMAASTPVTIATDDLLISVTKGARGPTYATGQLLNCVAGSTNYTLTVVASATYSITAVNGVIYCGIADTTVDANILWTVPASQTIIATIPSGTSLAYRSDAAGVTGRLARIQ